MTGENVFYFYSFSRLQYFKKKGASFGPRMNLVHFVDTRSRMAKDLG